MTFKPIDAKRDEFRKYLERTGVLEAISKVFIKLLQSSDRPENAIEFLCANLGASKEQADSNQHLKLELEDARYEIACLKREIDKLEAERSKKSSITAEDNDSKTNQNKSDDTTKTNQNTKDDETITTSNENDTNISSSEDTAASSEEEESNKTVLADENEKNEKETEPSSEKLQEKAEEEKN